MSQANRSKPILTPSTLLALLEETTQPDGDPRTSLLAARSVLNLVYVAEERELNAYFDDPISAFAPRECADVVAAPWCQLRETIDARIGALEAELEGMENEWFSMAEAV